MMKEYLESLMDGLDKIWDDYLTFFLSAKYISL